jgi:hypothetical protein
LLFEGTEVANGMWEGEEGGVKEGEEGKVVLEEDVTEWDHGMYEGWLGSEIRESRRSRGVDGEGEEWSIWRDGCEGGE